MAPAQPFFSPGSERTSHQCTAQIAGAIDNQDFTFGLRFKHTAEQDLVAYALHGSDLARKHGGTAILFELRFARLTAIAKSIE
jgi:hypothetical protein